MAVDGDKFRARGIGFQARDVSVNLIQFCVGLERKYLTLSCSCSQREVRYVQKLEFH